MYIPQYHFKRFVKPSIYSHVSMIFASLLKNIEDKIVGPDDTTMFFFFRKFLLRYPTKIQSI